MTSQATPTAGCDSTAAAAAAAADAVAALFTPLAQCHHRCFSTYCWRCRDGVVTLSMRSQSFIRLARRATEKSAKHRHMLAVTVLFDTRRYINLF